MPKAFPAEFRRDVVAVARRKEAPMSQVAKDFGISQSCLVRWVRRAEIEDGVRDGLTTPRRPTSASSRSATACLNRRTRSCAVPRSTSARASSQNDVPAGP
ncbi:MAG: transposase [Actinomycetota bacterium]|nr:transposase [Actinomycetota bacterium]